MKGKRRSILTSAEHEFLEKGFERASIDGILREVGGSKSTIYAHFRDKGALFAETLATIQRELDFGLPHSVPEEASTFHEGLMRLGVEFLSTLYSERALHLFRTVIAESVRFPEVARQLMDDGLERAVGRIQRYLDRCVAEGVIEPVDTGDAARVFAALLRSDTHLRLLLGLLPPPAPGSIDAMATAAVRAFETGFCSVSHSSRADTGSSDRESQDG
jgi:AcrR family transcriptional regulator